MALNNDNKINNRIKIVFLGSVKTGKTTFLMKIKGEKVDKDLKYTSTIGGTYASYQLIIEHKNYGLDFWDVGGQERFYPLIKYYIKDADILLFFYNSYDISSFEAVKRMVETCKEKEGNNAKYVLIRSRYDECLKINENINVVDEEALEYADLNNLYFMHLSNFDKNETANEFLKKVLNIL